MTNTNLGIKSIIINTKYKSDREKFSFIAPNKPNDDTKILESKKILAVINTKVYICTMRKSKKKKSNGKLIV